jgi:alpha/beta superfamily hydrolase
MVGVAEFTEVRRLERGPAGKLETLLTWSETSDSGQGVVIFSPSPLLGGDMENNVTEALAREAARRGLAALRVNYRNTGASEGDTGGLPRFEWWNDLEEKNDYAPVLEDAAAAIAAARPLFDPVALLGYSFGGWVAWRAAVKAGIGVCAAICPPLSRLDFAGLADQGSRAFLALAEEDGLDTPPPPAEVAARFPGVQVLPLEGADHFLLGREDEVASPTLDFVMSAIDLQGGGR